MRKHLIILLLFVGYFVSAQKTINNYQYVVVPSKFAFTSQTDQYRLNTLTKLLLEKYGFKAYLDTDPLPNAVAEPKCNKLYANVISFGNFMMTKMKIQLTDCNDQLVYESGIGRSKEKEFRVTYTQALREAFDFFDTLNYHYVPAETNGINPKAETPKTEAVILSEDFNNDNPMLYAQPIANGYQLVDATPKVIMKIFKTSNPNMFTALKENTQGVLMAKDNQWFFEYYQNDQLVSEKVNVKF